MPHCQIADQVDAHRLLVQVGNGRTTLSYKNDKQVFREGEIATFIAFVQQGSVKLTTPDESGIEQLRGIAIEGQFFGEACLHDLPVRSVTATAIGECRITIVTREAILCAIYRRAGFATMIVDYLSASNSWVRKDLIDRLPRSEIALA